ncbi:MAG TPA: family 78 glycoside hydrolase catalytic domain [Candidatus Sumerlaeota bacterium]|nr:family 78 glycoside hydrolase catalytic domain [Candidatus Sumerlaeota bacterium]
MRRGIIGLCFLGMLGAVCLGVTFKAHAAESDAKGDLRPARLRCEFQVNPLGVDAPQPRLSWEVESDARGAVQTGYQILAAGSAELLDKNQGDLWDTGRTSSSCTVQIGYKGKTLSPGQRVYWKVRVFDRAGRPSDFSPAAFWEMGRLDAKNWQAQWIGDGKPGPQTPESFYQDDPAPLFRKGFEVKPGAVSARLYVTGLGYYEARLNDKRVGDHVLDPGWTDYAKRTYYSVYDVTDALREGPNALGVMLGYGWYNPLPIRCFGKWNLREILAVGRPCLIAELHIRYRDGSEQVVASDGSWKTASGPVLRNSVYLGEWYDARLEKAGWDAPGFDEKDWQPAARTEGPAGRLVAQAAPPIRVTCTLKPVALKEVKPGVWVFDMGQNFAGCVRLRVKGKAGDRVTLTSGELVYEDGSLNARTTAVTQIKKGMGQGGPGAPENAFQVDTYVLKGSEEPEVWAPRFTFHGFRYVQVEGFPGKPSLDSLEGLRMNADVEAVGEFECSNDLFNRIQKAADWTFRSNIFSVQSDCPHREKFGYGGDILATDETFMFNYNMANFYEKTAFDFQDSMRKNGGFTETAPFNGMADGGLGGDSGPIGWASAPPWLLGHLYQYYGNRQLIEEQYDTLRRWTDFLISQAKDDQIAVCIGDHESVEDKPTTLTSTALYYWNVRQMSRFAQLLGKTEDAEKYKTKADAILKTFDRVHFDAQTGRYGSGVQAAQAFPLFLGMTPPEKRPVALEALVDHILNKQKGHNTAGIFGTRMSLMALSDLGRADVAYTMVGQKTFPGWGFMFEKGATTLWEHMEFSDNVYSHNHPMFGSVSEWFYRHVAGIAPAPDAVGFDRIVIAPKPGGGLTWATGVYRSVRGRVRCHWERAASDGGDKLKMEVEIPANTVAEIHVPARSASDVREGGQPAEKAAGLKFLRQEGGAAVYRAGSGRYAFESVLAK